MKPPRLAILLLIMALFTALPSMPQARPSAADWKDQGESDIGLAAQNEKDPVKQLGLLKKWEQQYPESAFKNLRTVYTAGALLNIIGAALTKPDKASTEAGQKAADDLLNHLSVYFDPAIKPATYSDEQWANAKKIGELQAHALLAQNAISKKDDATAEAEYRKILEVDPTQAATSYQLGALILHDIALSKNFARFPEALYELARSLSVTGPNALPPAGREAAEKALKANYNNYHGSPEGLDDLIRLTANSALPPSGLQIMNVEQIAAAKQKEHDEWAAQHPDLDLWETIRAALEAQGDEYFSANLKGVGLPPTGMFKGIVVAVQSPKQMLVNVDNQAGDALLKLDENIKGDIPVGTAVQFKGMVDSYTKSPAYVLAIEIQEPKTDITGLPDGVTFTPDKAATRSKK